MQSDTVLILPISLLLGHSFPLQAHQGLCLILTAGLGAAAEVKHLEQNAKGSKRKGQGVMSELGWHPHDGGSLVMQTLQPE